jgi:hypothetical protein
MAPLRRSIVGVLIVCFVWSSAWAGATIDAKVTKRFKVNWSSVSYGKTLNNPKVSPSDQPISERLSLFCKIEIRDPALTLGISGEGIITQLTDPNGRDVDPGPSASVQRGSQRMPYEGLRYRMRFVPPPQPSRWLAILKSALRLRQRAPLRPEPVSELQPSEMRLQLDTGLRERAGGKIRRVKGYFYALMAESMEHVDVPFAPDNHWVRLTDDLEIQVVQAQCTDSSYQFEIATRSQDRSSRMHMLSAGDSLPSRIVADRQFIGQDGKPIRHFSGFRRVPASVGGRGSGGGSNMGRVEKIRFVIAVNPAHYKIPFELEDIPLPEP